jgi:hypothetical protein
LVGAASELGEAELFGRHERGRSPYLKWLTYTSSRFLTGAAMGLTAQAVRNEVEGTAGLVAATIVASAVGEGSVVVSQVHQYLAAQRAKAPAGGP